MVDPRSIADEAAARAALAAGKGVAKRALEDLLSSDEDRAAKEAERAAVAKRRRTKLYVYGVIGALLVVGLVGMVIGYWQYFLLLGLLGVGGIYGRYRLRAWQKARAKAKGDASSAPSTALVEETARAEPRRERATAPTEDEAQPELEADLVSREAARREARALEEAQREARALEEARAEREIDEELSAMKARLRK